MPLLRLGPSAAAKEKRLASLLGGRDISGLGLAEAVRDAQVLGSLDLAGETTTLEEVRAARNGRASPAAAAGLVRAAAAVDPGSPPTVDALLAWHRALGPPTRVGPDGPRIEPCLQAAFQLSTEPLTSLLDEASERALDVMIQALTDRGA